MAPSPKRSLRPVASAPSASRPRLAPTPSAPVKTNLQLLLANFTEERLVNVLTQNASTPNKRRITNLRMLPKPSGRPKLVIKWGPPASGKGSAKVRAAIENLGDDYKTYFHLSIDSIIEATNWFKRTSRAMAAAVIRNVARAKGVDVSLNTSTINNVSNLLNKISKANSAKLGWPYSFVRNKFPLPGTPTRGAYRKPSDEQDALLGMALSLGRNVTIETTGSGPRDNSWPGWIFAKLKDPVIARYNYEVVFIFPLAPFSLTWERYKKRAIGSYKNGGGFRFGSTRGELRATYKASYQNFRNILSSPQQYEKIDRIMVIHPYPDGQDANFRVGRNAPYRTAAQRGGVRKFLQKFIEDVNANSKTNLNFNLKRGLGPYNNNGLPKMRPSQAR